MIELKRISESDYPHIIRMIEEGRRLDYFAPGDPITIESFRQYLTSGCYNNYNLVIAYDGTERIGYTDYYTFGGVGMILGIYVKDDSRRGGIGTMLLEHALGELQLLGCHKARTSVYSYNATASSFFSANGFEVAATLYDDEFHRNLLLMSRKISP